MDIITAQIVLAQGEAIDVTNTFKNVVAQAILEEQNALAIVVPAEGLVLYCQYYAMQEFYAGVIYESDFIAAWRCEGLYRNHRPLKTIHAGEEVEAGSLWLLRDDRLILMDEDRHVECPFNMQQQLFYKIV